MENEHIDPDPSKKTTSASIAGDVKEKAAFIGIGTAKTPTFKAIPKPPKNRNRAGRR